MRGQDHVPVEARPKARTRAGSPVAATAVHGGPPCRRRPRPRGPARRSPAGAPPITVPPTRARARVSVR
ncbi:hypothetical protein STXM2123_1183 [Streptomyces sp. F-3]|nr:hypothetical protein STXM2123_1183 [Streptomyces sp. F-3]